MSIHKISMSMQQFTPHRPQERSIGSRGMSGSPRRVRPEWARRVRRTRGRKIFWSTVSMGAFAAAAAGGFLWTLHESSQLEGSRRSIVLGVVGVGLVVATFDLLHPIRPKGAWLGVGMVAPAVALP